MQSAIYESVMFDNDGTLNGNMPFALGLVRTYMKKRSHGGKYNRNNLKGDIYAYLGTDDYKDKELKRLDRKWLNHLQKHGKLRPGGREILELLHTAKIPIGITSESSRRIHIDTVLERTGTNYFVKAVVGREDRLGRNKWEVLAERLLVDITKSIAVDDMTQGIDDAIEAKVGKVYALTFGFHTKKKITDHIQTKNYTNVERVDNMEQLMLKVLYDFQLISQDVRKFPPTIHNSYF